MYHGVHLSSLEYSEIHIVLQVLVSNIFADWHHVLNEIKEVTRSFKAIWNGEEAQVKDKIISIYLGKFLPIPTIYIWE